MDPCKIFNVKSVYERLTQRDEGQTFKRVWKAKLLAKIKTFMWLVEQKAILTKDNMIKRQWQGDPSCYFCSAPKTMDHLFFGCPIAKVVWGVLAICFQQNTRPSTYEQFWSWINMALLEGLQFHMLGLAAVCWACWKLRNRACFDKIILKNSNEILLYACAFMKYWAGLYPEDTQQLISSGVAVMMKTAMHLLGNSNGG
jgi:hypothetical protein